MQYNKTNQKWFRFSLFDQEKQKEFKKAFRPSWSTENGSNTVKKTHNVEVTKG